MLDIEDFEAVFPGIGYSPALVRKIVANKKQLGGKTFFERLLELLQIKWRKIYPPTSDDNLFELHKRIVIANISLHYKHCLFFYILKDLANQDEPETEIATDFARRVHLEHRFWTFVEGLWALDNLKLPSAVGSLTHPSIIPTFPDEILLVLLRTIDLDEPKEHILPLAYYNCANPPLAGHEVRTEFVKYMVERNLTEALFWIRERPEHEQKELIEVLVRGVLDKHQQYYGDSITYTRSAKATEFVSLPLSDEEEQWVESFLTEGKGRTLANAWDTLEMRRLATGRLREAAFANPGNPRWRGEKHDHINWENLQDGVKRGLGPRTDEEVSFGV